jgi:NAD(P)-dependent dehydrogenase (short-subunit alcohol dehydrogenase family)
VCVLTGASGLLGSAFMHRCAQQFCIIGVHNRHELDFASQHQVFIDPINVTRPVHENSDAVFAVRADLSDCQQIDRVCTEILNRFQQIDVLINGAVHRRPSELLAPLSLKDAELSFLVNVLAPLRLTIGFAQKFWSNRLEENIALRRHVINISSTAGLYVYPDLGQTIYSASKAALNYATYHLASELWDIGIRVNALAPNTFPQRVPTERVIDHILAFDESDDTGRVVLVDG